ncbi:MAG TPA: ATP-binding protein [Gemmatimonadaceae bacterium]
MTALPDRIPLVVLSIVVAAIGAYATIEIAQRVRLAEGLRRQRWIYGGVLAMAIGIWSMDFVGVLALRAPVPIWFDVLLIIASFIAALVASSIAFFIFNRDYVSFPLLIIASVLMGAAIAGVHYTAMAGMRTSAIITYDLEIVAASITIAVVASFAALFVTRRMLEADSKHPTWVRKSGPAFLLASAVIGMHYTAMAATRFGPSASILRTTDGLVRGTFQLALIVSIISILLLGVALAATQFERWSVATRSRFENLLELAPQVVWFAEPDGQITYCNPYWYNYTGFSERETIGYSWTNAIHPDDRDRVVWGWQSAVQAGKDYEAELRLRNVDGSFCWFLARSRPSRDESGKINAWLGIAVDIEERKKAEEGALAASQAKSEFLASMSHELRTPLNAIGGYAELLGMGIRGSLNAEQAQDVARIRRSQQHLLTLINDVLNFAKVDAGQAEYRLTSVPVDEALHDTESMIAPQILAKGLKYAYKGGDKTASVLADPEKLQQIVLNLLTNAVKFTDPGGSITLSATPRGSCIEISVADTGAGISSEKLEKVFDPFVQAERRLNQPMQGVGLGLAISRDLAHAMGGEITVESTVGKGSTFTLSLPRAPRMNPADVAAATAAPQVEAPAPADSPAAEAAPADSASPTELSDRSLEEAAHP